MTVSQTILDRNNIESIAQDGVVLGAWGPELTLSLLPSQVGVLTLNVPGRANTLSTEIIGNFSKALTMAENEEQIKALIFRSAKTDHFAYGADIKEISQFGTQEVAANHSRNGHKTFQQNLNITKPTVVAVHGPCLGGGLELALCYDKRICSNSSTTIFGLPEVTLGVVPGLGGTQRLCRKIPMKQALEVILMAQMLNVEEALKYGLIDESVAPEDLMKRAEEVALELCQSQKPEDKQQYKYEQKYAKETITQEESKQVASALKTFERILKMRVSENYPAPYLAIETIKCGLDNGLSEGLKKEIESFGILASSAVARNLIAFSFNKEIAVQSANRSLNQVGGIKELGVIGAGTMGRGICEVSLKADINVSVKTSSPQKTKDEAERLNSKNQKAIANAAVSYEHLSGCELIIESVYEDLEVKKEVLTNLSKTMSGNPDVIIATNTSSIPLDSLRQFVSNQENFLGLHFFNPVDRMPLVEVIPTNATKPAIQKKAVAYLSQIGKIPIIVKDCPGFLVNRLLTCLLLDAVRLADEGIPINWIEKAASDFGMPIPPFELFDELSWDIATACAIYMEKSFGKRYTTPLMVSRAVTLAFQGKKTNAGCYLWNDGKKAGLNPEFLTGAQVKSSEEPLDEKNRQIILDRLFLPMVDEAARCLEEKVVRKAKEIDLAIIIGIGFPPFRGGLLKYADTLGIDYITDKLGEIYTNHEPKREVSKLLNEMKSTARGFYGPSKEA